MRCLLAFCALFMQICRMASKICVLDDDHAFLQNLRLALAGGYEVDTFPDASGFREVLSPRSFDPIVLDMRLEGAKEGLSVLREIHRADPYQPVVVATAYADTDTYLETLQAGALLYLDKTRHTPASMALLFDAVIQQGSLRREQSAKLGPSNEWTRLKSWARLSRSAFSARRSSG